MKRAKKQAVIKEYIKHFLEEIWRLTPEETPYKIFYRETQKGVDDFLALSKDEIHELSYKTEDRDSARLTSVDTKRIRTLLHFKFFLLEQDLCPEDG